MGKVGKRKILTVEVEENVDVNVGVVAVVVVGGVVVAENIIEPPHGKTKNVVFEQV